MKRSEAELDWAHEIAVVLTPLVSRLGDNLQRVQHLVTIYKNLYGTGKGRRAVHKSDLLRAAVVFLHATLEDMLRVVAKLYLPVGGEQALNAVPLAGSSGHRADKFLLGRLVNHRGKTVDELLRESVEQFLERSNYNSTTEIAALFENLGIPVTDEVRGVFPLLDSLMKRRHQIVHQADRLAVPGRGRQRARSIGTRAVEEWVNAVRAFSVDVIAFVIESEIRGQLRQRLGVDGRELEILMHKLRSGQLSRDSGDTAKVGE